MRAEYLLITGQSFLKLCDLQFACPCTERYRLITAREILPRSFECHGSKLTPTMWNFPLLAFTNLSEFAVPAYLDLLTSEEQNYLRQLTFSCLFFKHCIQNKLHSNKKREKLCITKLKTEWQQELTKQRQAWKHSVAGPLVFVGSWDKAAAVESRKSSLWYQTPLYQTPLFFPSKWDTQASLELTVLPTNTFPPMGMAMWLLTKVLYLWDLLSTSSSFFTLGRMLVHAGFWTHSSVKL